MQTGSIIKEITTSPPEALEVANVVSDACDMLRDIYSKSLNILDQLVSSSNDLTKYYLPFDVEKTIKLYSSKRNLLSKLWGWLRELSEEDKKTIQYFLDVLNKDVDISLKTKEQSRNPYNKNDLTSILKSIQIKIEEKNKNLKNFKIPPEIEIAFAVSICGHAIKKLEIIDENFRNANDPILNLEKDKNDYEQIFIALLDETKATVNTTTKLGDIILDGICQRIDQVLPDKICDHIQLTTHPNILAHKNVLLARIMISLAEEENFDQYITYIHSFKTSLSFWLSRFFDESNSMSGGIRGLIENEINHLVKSIEKILKDIKDAVSIESWTEQFYEKANNKIGIKDLNQVNIMGSKIKDFDCDALQDELTQRLENARPHRSRNGAC